MGAVVFLTGATGFLGTHVAIRLIRNTDSKIITLIRAKDKEAATNRLSRILWDWPDVARSIGSRIQVLAGDISETQFGLDNVEYDNLVRIVTHIIHSAADIRLNGPIEELRKANVQGTDNVLEFGRAVNHHHGLERFSHISTAYVAGWRRGAVSEDSLTDEYGFSNNYEFTKYESEKLVQEAKTELPISIFRPGLIVGDSQTGAIKTFNTLYYPLKLYLTGRLRIFPISPSLRVNLVPVDYAADVVTRLTFIKKAESHTFHVTVPWEKLPKAYDLFNIIRKWAKEQHNMRLPRPILIPIPAAVTIGCFRLIQKLARRRRSRLLDALITLGPYFTERRQYLRDNIDELDGLYDFRWQDVIRPILEFAYYLGFFHRTERTVHEQVMYRLKSRSMPITYYDVIEGNIITRNTTQIYNEMLTVAEALRSMGVSKGDRIALVGPNSSRYLVIDVAIGLVGAVSVPLYYTSPVDEITNILNASDTKILFIGSPEILKRIEQIGTDIPVVSFCREEPKFIHDREVVTWNDLIEKANHTKGRIDSPVTFEDLATIRYTSSTMGRFKGACFDHGQIRWMAESLCSLFPWKIRNSKICYISFLPMNYVVEGLLAAYSPYYTPSKVRIYFLENIRDLEYVLPRIRPTLFSSIPRFYEKLWSGLIKTKIGCTYANAGEGLRCKLLRPILRRLLLKKTGLDRCEQLIVGSAPSDERLLHNFQKLGIEIYNAYGLAEAPLVTMNRLGFNRISTVGEPIVETRLRIADDGEILVQGPQLTRGYLDQNIESPFEDGWLLTGDLGYITREGSLIISGRKKERIKTSYGRSIDPIKVESMLRQIPYVEEAILVGDNRPYCCALLWVGAQGEDSESIDSVERTIYAINNQLSHPEQVRRWAVLKNDLSIERGDLTSSMKLKRTEVMQRFSNVITCLYEGSPTKVSSILRISMTDARNILE